MFSREILTLIATTYYRLTCAKFGSNSIVRWGTWISYPSNVFIGDNVFIANNVLIGSELKDSLLHISSSVQINDGVVIDYTGGITIAENTLIAQQSIIYSHSHGLNPHSKPKPMPKNIGSNCWLGARCLILESCSQISSGSIIGAGSTVTKDIDKKGIYAGVPARFIRMLPDVEKE
ncbi:acyltransferase [Rivularia sp. PCC 7116]|uniref:acyltransferase n=1 Tax=Rivularia sp. PCC 7116 TaxID=373994 RepID=UPI0005C7ABBA|nr:acyltransferase [Rivularia sp. PCC 7116]